MKLASPFSIYIRIFLISLAVALLGLAPIPHAAVKYLTLAYQASTEGNWRETSLSLAGAAQYYPWWDELKLEAGRAAFRGGDLKTAIKILDDPTGRADLASSDLLLLGDAYSQDGDGSKAETYWKRAIEVDNSSQAHERLVSYYLQRKEYPSAIGQLKQLLTLNPSNIPLYYQIGSLYAASDPIAALAFLIQATKIDPTNASQAQSLYDKIRTANLFDEPAYTLLISGRQLAQAGQWELAAEAFRNSIKIKPDYVDAWAFLGEAEQQAVIQQAGKSSSAGLAELEHALKLDPSSSLAHTFTAMYWERQQDYSKAQSSLLQAIQASPKDPFLYTEMGSILGKAGDLPSAQSAYEEAIQLAPNDPLFYRLLAEFALQYQIQIRELALPAARQALRLDPQGAESLDLMAQVMLALQDYHSAERFALDALAVEPGYSLASLHLGITYLYLRQPDLARQWLARTEATSPGSQTASQAKRMLEYYFP